MEFTAYVITSLPGVRLVARTALVAADELSERIGPMFDAVAEKIGHIPGSLARPIATYEMSEAGVHVVVGYAYAGDAPEGTEAVELAPVEAVCRLHHGAMDSIRESWDAVHQWVAQNGYVPAGPSRARYIIAEGEDQSGWVTELQQPVLPRAE